MTEQYSMHQLKLYFGTLSNCQNFLKGCQAVQVTLLSVTNNAVRPCTACVYGFHSICNGCGSMGVAAQL
jgi:hypothetical protein